MKTGLKTALCAMIAVALGMSYSCSNDDKQEEPSGYIYSDGHSYLIVKESKTWADAAADAVAKGGYLAEINSQAEQDAIYQGIVGSGISASYASVTDGGGIAYIWIGASDRAKEGDWRWNGANSSDGGKAFWSGNGSGKAVDNSYVNWGGKAAGSLNEPDNFTDSQYSPQGQNAAAIGLAKWPAGGPVELGRAGEWNDISETNKIYYIIEFDSVK